MTPLAERKAFAIAAIEALSDTEDMTMAHIHAIRALSGCMPTDEADGALEMLADDLAHGVRVSVEMRDPDLPFWNAADRLYDERRAA